MFIEAPTEIIPAAKTTGLKPWLVCFCAALFFFYEFIQMNMFSAIDPDLMRDFAINATQLGQLSACYFYANVLFLFPAGMLLDRYSTRNIILIAMFLCVAGTILFATAKTLALAKFCRFVTGIGSAFCFLSPIRLASRWFASQRLALVTGLIVTMAMLGGIVAQTPLTLLAQAVGWRHSLGIIAALGAVIILLVGVFVQDYPPGESPRKADREQLAAIGFWRSLQLALLRVQNWLGGIYTCLLNLPVILLGSLWGSLYLTQVHHLTRTQASVVVTMIFVGTVIGSPLAGWISDRMELRKLPMQIGAFLSLMLMVWLMSAAVLTMTGLLIIFFGLGLITSSQIITYPTIAESNPKLLTATAVSVISFSAQSAGVIFQPLFGKLMDLHWQGQIADQVRIYSASDYHLALSILPIGFALALLVAFFIRETYCRPQINE